MQEFRTSAEPVDSLAKVPLTPRPSIKTAHPLDGARNIAARSVIKHNAAPNAMRILMAILLVATTLAGCTSPDAASPADDEIFEDVSVSSGKGLIRGVVVDGTITPVPDAKVEVVGQDTEQRTTEGGAFQFTNLEPGSYFLAISKPGWSRVQQGAIVIADEEKPDIIRVLLEFLPGSVPQAQTVQIQGFIKCGAGTPATFHDCADVDPSDRSTVSIPYEGAPDHIQIETQWTSTQPSGDQLYLVYFYCSDTCGNRADRWDEGNRDGPWVARHSAPLADNEAAVYASPGGPADGTGTSIDQRFDVFMTFFYNIEEPDADWTFIGDGEYQV